MKIDWDWFRVLPPNISIFLPSTLTLRMQETIPTWNFLWKLFQTINFIPPFNKFSRWIQIFSSLPRVEFDWQFDDPLMMTGLQILDFSSICFWGKLSQNLVGQHWAGSQSFLSLSRWNCWDYHWVQFFFFYHMMRQSLHLLIFQGIECFVLLDWIYHNLHHCYKIARKSCYCEGNLHKLGLASKIDQP